MEEENIEINLWTEDGYWRIRNNEELHELFSSTQMIGVNKISWIKWISHDERREKRTFIRYEGK